MAIIPYPQVPLHSIRTTDVVLLLAFGALWEFVIRITKLSIKRKPNSIRRREAALKKLDREVIRMRAKGPSAFVATSKLERQQLAENKALAKESEERANRVVKMEAMTRKVDIFVCLVIFLMWYSVPVLEFSAHRVLDNASADPTDLRILSLQDGENIAGSEYKAMLFPLSYVGLGIRVSRLGLPNPGSSMGALLAYWSAQTFVSQFMDCADALFE